MRKSAIYGLVDPRDGQLRYVGKTTRKLSRRLIEHLGKSTKKTHKSNWLAALAKLGLKPTLVEIQVVDIEVENQAETHWIAYFKSLGFRLTNGTVGGDGLVGFRKLDQQTRDLAVDLYRVGYGIAEIGIMYEVSGETIRSYLAEVGVERRVGSPRKTIDREQVKALYLSGLSAREVGATLSANWTSILRVLKEEGVQIRPPGRPRARPH